MCDKLSIPEKLPLQTMQSKPNLTHERVYVESMGYCFEAKGYPKWYSAQKVLTLARPEGRSKYCNDHYTVLVSFLL